MVRADASIKFAAKSTGRNNGSGPLASLCKIALSSLLVALLDSQLDCYFLTGVP
jgi:hypothetical protein